MALFNRLGFADLLLAIVLVTLTAGVAHLVITSPLTPWRLLYYVQAPLILSETRCSLGAPAWMEEIQRYTTSKMAAPSSQLAFLSPDGSLHHCETGWEDGIFGERLLEPETRFRFASVTKTVTAAAIIDLINTGRLSLEDNVADILELEGEPKDPRVKRITVADLLEHRGGWDRERTQDVMFLRNRKPWCPYYPEQLFSGGLLHEPGEKEVYSNLGYCLLGVVVEKVTGQSYRTYVAERFDFDSSTLLFIDGPYLADEVRYDFRHENFYTDKYYEKFDFQALSSAAGLSGNAVDLVKLLGWAVGQEPLSILGGDMTGDCDPSKLQACYGYGLYRYQPKPEDMPLYIQDGKLPGGPTAVIVDSQGGVLVWLGGGGPRPGTDATQQFYNYVRKTLTDYYAANVYRQ